MICSRSLLLGLMLVLTRMLTAQTSADIDHQIQRAKALQEKGQEAEARKIYDSLLPVLRQKPPSAQLAFVLNGISQLAADAGDYKAAIQSAEEAAHVYRELNDRDGEAHAFNNKGIAEVESGTYPAAQADFQSALALADATNDPENQVQTLNNLGSDYYYQGKYLEGLRSYQRAMTILDAAAQAKWAPYWRQITDINTATLFQRLGRYETALEIYRRVQSTSKSLTPSDRAHLLGNLGVLYRRLGDPWKALDTYRSAQSLYAKEHDSDGEIGVLKNIGIVYAMDMEDLDAAQRIFRQALQLGQKTHNRREEMQAHLYLGETFLRKQILPEAQAEFEHARDLAEELGTIEEQWKAWYGLGRVSEEKDDEHSAEVDYRTAITIIEQTRVQLQLSALRAEFLADKRDAYDGLIRLLIKNNDVPEAFSFLERARARTFQDRVAGAKLDAAVRPLSIDEVRSYVSPDVVLLELWVSPEQIAVIWCTRDSRGIAAEPITGSQVGAIRNFLNAMPDNLGENWRANIQALDPLRHLVSKVQLGGIKHLLIVQDNWTSLVPFELLSAAPETTDVLVDRFDITYLPSAMLLRRPQAGSAIHFPWARELVAFGDPVINEDDVNRSPDLPALYGAAARLPFSAEEIHSVESMVKGRADIFLSRQDVKKEFLGGKANQGLLLHVSTHAFADVDNPEDSRLLFSSEQANLPADYVFLRELYELDLSHVAMATISACDTERGRIIRGEGVQAFSRALLGAGARSSLTTLWRVEDQATAEFMRQFYFYLLEKRMSRTEALRQAKLKMLHSDGRFAAPAYWAAFVLNGEGLTQVPRVVSWTTLIFALVVVTAAFYLLQRWLNRSHGS